MLIIILVEHISVTLLFVLCICRSKPPGIPLEIVYSLLAFNSIRGVNTIG